MRKRIAGDLTVNAIAGSSGIFFGFDLSKAKAKGLMGFSILRRENEEPEVKWLRSSKSFKSIRESAALEDYISKDHPFQAFQWSDYSVQPGKTYIYEIAARYGKPGALVDGPTAKVKLTTEKLSDGGHGIYFNRGAIASQYYAKRFGPVDPEHVGPAAYDWLARDLLQGILTFIARAKSKKFKLHAAIFETKVPVVLQALKQASVTASLEMIVEGKPGTSTTTGNIEALANAGLGQDVVTFRANAKLAHNKFIVLSDNNTPIAVWTGSTNLSRNAIYGQLNVGHAIESKVVAAQYLAYWEALKADPDGATLKDWTEEEDPTPEIPESETEAVFLPHRGKAVYEWFLAQAASAKRGLAMTFPFGMSKEFRELFADGSAVFRMGLLDKFGNGGNIAAAKAETEKLRFESQHVMLALGERIFSDKIDGWLKEADGIGNFVNWVHTKFMLVDPLTDNPTTITGSANWSEPSMNANDENMLVIRKDKRVADIYFTEFMRLYDHHRFREALARHLKDTGHVDDWKPRNLIETSAEWVDRHYKPGSQHFNRRKYFSSSD